MEMQTMKQWQAVEIEGTTYMRQKQKPRSWPFQTVKLKKIKMGIVCPSVHRWAKAILENTT